MELYVQQPNESGTRPPRRPGRFRRFLKRVREAFTSCFRPRPTPTENSTRMRNTPLYNLPMNWAGGTRFRILEKTQSCTDLSRLVDGSKHIPRRSRSVAKINMKKNKYKTSTSANSMRKFLMRTCEHRRDTCSTRTKTTPAVAKLLTDFSETVGKEKAANHNLPMSWPGERRFRIAEKSQSCNDLSRLVDESKHHYPKRSHSIGKISMKENKYKTSRSVTSMRKFLTMTCDSKRNACAARSNTMPAAAKVLTVKMSEQQMPVRRYLPDFNEIVKTVLEEEAFARKNLPMSWAGERRFRIVEKCQSCINLSRHVDESNRLPRRSLSVAKIGLKKKKYETSRSVTSMKWFLTRTRDTRHNTCSAPVKTTPPVAKLIPLKVDSEEIAVMEYLKDLFKTVENVLQEEACDTHRLAAPT